jgi:Family of unknown function (DUF6011)
MEILMTIYSFPKVVSLVRDKEVKLHLSNSKIVVTQMNRMMLVSLKFGNGMWGSFAENRDQYGRFKPNKTFFQIPQHEAKQMLNDLVNVELNGLVAVKEISKLTGNCCVCGRKLTNEASIEEGIGPICSGKMEGAW